MGIKFLCPNGHKLHVKSFLAGKKAICPKCGVRVLVPFDGAVPDAPGPADSHAEPISLEAASTAPLAAALVDDTLASAAALDSARSATGAAIDPIAETPTAVWYVRPSTGGQYGPASGPIMRGWLEQGRVGATSLVWRDGWSEWRSAADAFPELAAQMPAPGMPSVQPTMVAANGAPPLPAQSALLPLGHVVSGVPEIPPSLNLPPALPPLATAARKRRRKNETRLILSAVLGVISVILVIVLVLVFRAQNAPEDQKTQASPPASEEPMN